MYSSIVANPKFHDFLTNAPMPNFLVEKKAFTKNGEWIEVERKGKKEKISKPFGKSKTVAFGKGGKIIDVFDHTDKNVKLKFPYNPTKSDTALNNFHLGCETIKNLTKRKDSITEYRNAWLDEQLKNLDVIPSNIVADYKAFLEAWKEDPNLIPFDDIDEFNVQGMFILIHKPTNTTICQLEDLYIRYTELLVSTTKSGIAKYPRVGSSVCYSRNKATQKQFCKKPEPFDKKLWVKLSLMMSNNVCHYFRFGDIVYAVFSEELNDDTILNLLNQDSESPTSLEELRSKLYTKYKNKTFKDSNIFIFSYIEQKNGANTLLYVKDTKMSILCGSLLSMSEDFDISILKSIYTLFKDAEKHLKQKVERDVIDVAFGFKKHITPDASKYIVNKLKNSQYHYHNKYRAGKLLKYINMNTSLTKEEEENIKLLSKSLWAITELLKEAGRHPSMIDRIRFEFLNNPYKKSLDDTAYYASRQIRKEKASLFYTFKDRHRSEVFDAYNKIKHMPDVVNHLILQGTLEGLKPPRKQHNK